MRRKEWSDPAKWVDEYGDYLFRYALSRLFDPHLAEEIVQETFLAALTAFEGFKGEASIKTWLVGILKHKIVDHFRKTSREKPYESVDTLYDREQTIFDEKGGWKTGPAKWQADPGKIYEDSEFWDTFRECLRKLPKKQLDLFVLREIEGKKSDEICMLLDITPTNLWVTLYRVRMSLRKCLEDTWFGTHE